MNKSDLVNGIMNATSISERDAERAVTAIIGVIKDAYDKNERITITGFGSFVPVIRKQKVALNFRTQEHCIVPERKVLTFKPTAAFYVSGK